MQIPVIDEYLEPRFRAKNKKRKKWSPLNLIICYEDKIKKEETESK